MDPSIRPIRPRLLDGGVEAPHHVKQRSLGGTLTGRQSRSGTRWGRRLAWLISGALVASSLVGGDLVSARGKGTPQRSYIVLLENAADARSIAESHSQRYAFAPDFVYEHALQGYAASMSSEAAQAISRSPQVASVVEDKEFQLVAETIPTGVSRIDAPRQGNLGHGVHVAVIDTGIDLDHPDLQASLAGGRNCAGGSSFDDGNGHGTHVAGTIASAMDGSGVVGVSPGVKLWAVRVLNNFGMGFTSWIVCGIDFVASMAPANGGRLLVANMSLGGPGADDGDCGRRSGDVMHEAICNATAAGVTFVVAAGNDGADLRNSTPAAYDEVLTVTALNDSDGLPCGQGPPTNPGADDTFAGFSNFATLPADVAHTVGAPGVDVLSTWRDGGYRTASGTSMASPHVAGTAALFIRRYALAKRTLPAPATVIQGLVSLAEPPDISFGGECPSGSFSHTDPGGTHPEPVVRAKQL